MHRTLLVAAITTVFLGPCSFAQSGPDTGIAAHQPDEEAPRNTKEWSLDEKKNYLAIEGYDPVGYFPEGGGSAVKGKPEFEYTHAGATYRFSSKANLDRFKANPTKYEPAHGGWCSWAMRQGEKTKIDPKSFIVKDGRLLLFYKDFFTNTRTQWLKGDHDAFANEADRRWKEISGEDARKG